MADIVQDVETLPHRGPDFTRTAWLRAYRLDQLSQIIPAWSLAIFTAFLVAAGLLGPLGEPAARTVLTLLLYALAVRTVPSLAWPRAVVLLLVPLLPILLGPVVDHLQSTLALLAVIVVAWFGSVAGTPEAHNLWSTRQREATAIASASVAILYILSQNLTSVWSLLEMIASGLSSVASLACGQRISVGPTFAGLWPGLLVLVYIMAAARRLAWPHRLVLAVLTAVILGLLLTLYIAGLPWVESLVRVVGSALVNPPEAYVSDRDQPGMAPPGLSAAYGGSLLLLLGLLVCAERLAIPMIQHLCGTATPARSRSVWHPRWALLGGLAGCVLGSVLLTWRAAAPALGPGASPVTVAFFEGGHWDLSKPSTDAYGLIRAGLYGSLADFLTSTGHRVVRLPTTFAPEDLAAIDILVVINPGAPLTPVQHEATWMFVKRGGGLLVLGDHTDLLDTQGPLNALLAPVGIAYEFDSAFPLRLHWQQALHMRPHAITIGMRDQRDIQIGTGASLTLSGGAARPIIVGRYAFGDFGNRLNDGRGGRLGNYRYELGERLGDVVLVAEKNHGHGRIVVFGDTTTFQVLSMPYSFAFVDGLMRHLATGASRTVLIDWLGIGCLILGGSLLWAGCGGGCALVLMAGVLALVEPIPEVLDRRVSAIQGPTAVIDTRSVPRMPFVHFDDGSVGGFFTALYRAGYFPMIGKYAEAMKSEAAMIAFLQPSRGASLPARQWLEGQLQRGGTILVAASGPNLTAANQLLASCAMWIENRPLGPAKTDQSDGQVELMDAWSVGWDGTPTPETFLALDGYPIWVTRRVGAGRCLVLGDGRFFVDTFLEGEYTFKKATLKALDRFLTVGKTP